MSLINSMLHDLEERHALAGAHGDKVLHDLHAVDERGFESGSGRTVLSRSLLLLTGILICYISYDFYSDYYPSNSAVTTYPSSHQVAVNETAAPPVKVERSKQVVPASSDKLEIDPQGIELKFASLDLEPATVTETAPPAVTEINPAPVISKPAVVKTEAPAPVEGQAGYSNRLLHIGMTELAGAASVLVNTSTSPDYKLFILKKPDRLLVEIKDMEMPAGIVDDVYRNNVVKRLRHTYRGDTALLIFDLKQRVEIHSTDIREMPDGGYSMDIELLLPEMETAVNRTGGDSTAVTSPASAGAGQSGNEFVDKTFQKNASEPVEDALFKDAVTAYRTGDVVHAIALLHRVLTKTPGYIQAREMLTTILLQQGDKQGAYTLLSEGIKLHPRNTKFIKLYAKLLLDKGQTDRALAYLKQTQPAITEDPEYYALTAAVLQRRKEYLEAGEIYRQLVAIDPGKGVWWMGLGIALEGLGRQGEALQAYGNARRDRTLASDVSRYIESRIRILGG